MHTKRKTRKRDRRKAELIDGCWFIPLTKGARAKVDASDVSWLEGYSWQLSSKGYAIGRVFDGEAWVFVAMHRWVAAKHKRLRDSDLFVDHIDGDTLNNTPENLRECSHSENAHNSKVYTRSTTGEKGVSRRPSGRFRVRVRVNGKCVNIGHFTTKEEAASAASTARKSLHGCFARDR